MKKRILHIGTSGGRGGVESFILNTSSQISKDKCSFSIIADCEKAIIEEDFRKIGDVIYIPAITKNKKGYVKGLWKAIDKSKYDIVHIHKNSLSNPLPVLFCKMKGIKNVILHSHNTMPADKGASTMVHKVFRSILNLFKLERIACSELAAEWMFGKKKSRNVLMLKNGINADRLRFNETVRSNKRSELGLDENAVAICNVGRLSEQKNTMFILKIFGEVCSREENAHLFLIGNGPLKEEAEAFAAASGYGSRIHFLGIRQDIPDLLQGMDLFLMPSLHEGLPIAAVEAQAASLPLLISDTVDTDVKLLESTEFEELDASAEVWAEHCLELVRKTVRGDVTADIRRAGYDLSETAAVLEKLYCK